MSIDKLSKAIEILVDVPEFAHIQLIGELSWSSIPQSYKLVKSFIINSYKVEVYQLNSNVLVKIDNVGLFQIM